jgi:hypothetical protein
MRFKAGLLTAIALLTMAGCADFNRGPAPVDAGEIAPVDAEGIDGGSLYPDSGSPDISTPLVADLMFETTVYPVLLMRCEDCHKAGKEGAYTKFVLTGNGRQDRAMVMALVSPSNPEESLLLQRARGEWHTGGERLSANSTEYETILNWIWTLDATSQASKKWKP